jgi:hypothetical protein
MKAIPLKYFKGIYEKCQKFCKNVNYFEQNGKNVNTLMKLVVSMEIHAKETLDVRKELEEYGNNPKLEFCEDLEEKEKTIWESIHNELCAHQSAEHCIILRQFRGHFLKKTGTTCDKWTAALYSVMSGRKFTDRNVHDMLKIARDKELAEMRIKYGVTIFCVQPKAKP